MRRVKGVRCWVIWTWWRSASAANATAWGLAGAVRWLLVIVSPVQFSLQRLDALQLAHKAVGQGLRQGAAGARPIGL